MPFKMNDPMDVVEVRIAMLEISMKTTLLEFRQSRDGKSGLLRWVGLPPRHPEKPACLPFLCQLALATDRRYCEHLLCVRYFERQCLFLCSVLSAPPVGFLCVPAPEGAASASSFPGLAMSVLFFVAVSSCL
ncbi:hypothetical protein RJT34_22760 [Clitoria ternatea]|uniref:Uncharacterized protein n=1 Tax=Clitoria ternatea TaxID=43366 RepID=A0AAN9FKK5_CLITE